MFLVWAQTKGKEARPWRDLKSIGNHWGTLVFACPAYPARERTGAKRKGRHGHRKPLSNLEETAKSPEAPCNRQSPAMLYDESPPMVRYQCQVPQHSCCYVNRCRRMNRTDDMPILGLGPFYISKISEHCSLCIFHFSLFITLLFILHGFPYPTSIYIILQLLQQSRDPLCGDPPSLPGALGDRNSLKSHFLMAGFWSGALCSLSHLPLSTFSF